MGPNVTATATTANVGATTSYGGDDHQKYLTRKGNTGNSTPSPSAAPTPPPDITPAPAPSANLALVANDSDDWQWGFAGLNL